MRQTDQIRSLTFMVVVVILATVFNTFSIMRLNNIDVTIAKHIVATHKVIDKRIRELAE